MPVRVGSAGLHQTGRGAKSSSNALLGTGLALIFGIALIAAGASMTSRLGTGDSGANDGARLLRQARTPMQQQGVIHLTPEDEAHALSLQKEAIASAAGLELETSAASEARRHSEKQQKMESQLQSRAADPMATGCLVTQWAAVWLVHDGRMRSHVAVPTAQCDMHASEIEDVNQYTKSHGGEGAYTLDEEQSRRACERPGCFPAKKRAKDPYPGDGGPNPLAEPPGGWGTGAQQGWQKRSGLQLNEAAQKLFSQAPPPAGEPLLLVFGGATVNDMLRNWADHARENTGMLYCVACMDAKLFALANEHHIPAVMMAKSGGDAESAVETRWKYYRMDPKAFMQMGILKVRFFMEFLRAGFDLLCSDLDVVWLSDPRPFLSGKAMGTALLPLADVVVSTDVTSGINDHDGASWGLYGELNTGIILLRSTRAALALCDEWIRRMQKEMVERPPPSGGFLQWWSNDQTFFNEVVHRATEMRQLGLGLKASSDAIRREAAGLVRRATPLAEGRLKHLEATLANMTALHAAIPPQEADLLARGTRLPGTWRDYEQVTDRRPRTAAQYFAALRNVQFKRLTCRACGGEGQLPLAIGTLPYLHFASGHTFFTQSLQERNGFMPACVHTTFQFGDTAEFTWGKRSRLREKGLWAVDDDGYYRRQGTGTHPAEASYEGFLQLTGDLMPPDLDSLTRNEASATVKLEGVYTYVGKALENTVPNVFNLPIRNPNRHLLLDAFQRRLVHNAMALGRALRRKVIMPRMQCWCDRFWNPMANCRMPGVSASQHPLPFHCPFDHVYDLEKWVHSDAPFREYSFLNHSRILPSDRADAVELGVQGARGWAANELGAATSPGADGKPRRTLTMGVGDSYSDVKGALSTAGWGSAYVLTVDARSIELLCEHLGSTQANREFNAIMHTVLGVAEQVRYCDEFENPTYGIGPNAHDEWANPINCTWGFHRPPPLPEAEPVQCLKDAAAMLASRLVEPKRSWDNVPRWSGPRHGRRRQAWSTNDRPAYLHKQ